MNDLKDLMSHAERMRNPYIVETDLSTYTIWGAADLPPGAPGAWGGTKPLWDAKTNVQYVGMFWDISWIADPALINWEPWNAGSGLDKTRDSRISLNGLDVGVETKLLLVYELENGRPKLRSAFISDPFEQAIQKILTVDSKNTDTGHADYALEMLSFFSLDIPKLSKIDSGKMNASYFTSLLPDSMGFTKKELEEYFGEYFGEGE